jgi:TolB-like protein/DNA-binding winged helix-turn-helix (wHTH) protein/Tfp pilus assembly protein PilF
MASETTTYRFGPYRVNPRTRELSKHGIRLKLRPQPFQVLQALVQRAGDVVSREELRCALWTADTYVDFEHGLNTSIKELRGVLGDSASEPRYIETLPKLGYRMIAPVEAEGPTAPASRIDEPQTAEPEGQADKKAEDEAVAGAQQQPLLRRLSPVLVGLVLLLALAAYWQRPRSRIRSRPAGGRLMLAVLPFENLTGDATQEYLSDALTEEMIAQLGRLNPEQLGVIARTSAMHYKHSPDRVFQIGQELNVQYVMEGSIRRSGDRVRVSAQLIRVQDEAQAWARQYDRQITNLLSIEDEIAREISDEIQLTLGDRKPSSPVNRPSLSPQQSEAYDLYLKGLYFWNKRSTDDFWQAAKYFQQAISKDPNSAPSYAGLANCYALVGGYSNEPRPEYMIQARSAALHALQLDETLPEAHTALAVIVQNYDLDWPTAEREYQRAIALNPNYATAHQWYAEHLGYRGRFDEAFRESERARHLDPLSLIIGADNAILLYYSRQYDRSVDKFQAVLEMDPTFTHADQVVLPYLEKGMFAEALARIDRLKRTYSDQPVLWSDLAYINGRSGRQEQARRAVEKLKQLYRPEQDPKLFVLAYLGLGDKEQAIAWLERAYAQHSNELTTLKVDPAYDPLRGDPRFQELLHRVGLTP